MKRFYTAVSVDDDFTVCLDGKPVKTPGRDKPLSAPTRALADAVAVEWAAQEKTVLPETMPLTQILTTVLDQGEEGRDAVTEKVLAYLNTDLLCYRVDQPAGLADMQAQRRDPWLDWFAGAYGVTLDTTTGLSALTQPAAAGKAVAAALGVMDDARFTVCQIVTALTGSVILALAFMEGAATPRQLYEAANMEEDFKAALYNEAEHGSAPQQEKRQKAMMRDLEAVQSFLNGLSSATH